MTNNLRVSKNLRYTVLGFYKNEDLKHSQIITKCPN